MPMNPVQRDFIIHRKGDTLALTVSRNIVRRRSELGWSQQEVAEAAGLSNAALSRIEAASSDPKLSTVVALARALDMSVGDIIACSA
jgi:XRE family transcriptional regulator, regulator of sulfur utilization